MGPKPPLPLLPPNRYSGPDQVPSSNDLAISSAYGSLPSRRHAYRIVRTEHCHVLAVHEYGRRSGDEVGDTTSELFLVVARTADPAV